MSSADIKIRSMLEEDLSQVQALDKISFSRPWPDNAFQIEFANKGVSFQWVAEASFSTGNSCLAGVIVIWLILDEAHIATIAVHPDYRRCGIGRKMLGHALLGLINIGAEKAFLEVRSGNLPAQTLYLQFDFSVTTVRRHYYQDNQEDALLMTLEPLTAERIRQAARLDIDGKIITNDQMGKEEM